MFFRSLLQDGIDGSWSSKRVVTFLAFVFCSIAFFANLFFDKKVDPAMFEAMIYLAMAGLGATVTEKFATRTTSPYSIHFHEPINNKQTSGTPLPKLPEKEI